MARQFVPSVANWKNGRLSQTCRELYFNMTLIDKGRHTKIATLATPYNHCVCVCLYRVYGGSKCEPSIGHPLASPNDEIS